MSQTKRILVTGGAGMIGSSLVKALVKSGHKVKVVDNLWRGSKDYLKDEHGQAVINMEQDFHLIDLSKPGMLTPLLEDIDYVYHLADIVAGIDYVFANQGSVFRQNILINSNTIAAVRENPVKGFIYVGTACSFPAHLQTGIDAAPLKEQDMFPAAPESAYGWSKLMGDYETFLMSEETGIPVAVLSFHNVYGPPCDYSEQSGQVIPSLIRKAILYPQVPFTVWGSGLQGRSFVYVSDIINALIFALDKGMNQGLIQIGTNTCTTIKEIAQTIVDISGKNIDIQFDTKKREGDKGRCADYTKAQSVLGWQPQTSLRQGLENTYTWISNQLKTPSNTTKNQTAKEQEL